MTDHLWDNGPPAFNVVIILCNSHKFSWDKYCFILILSIRNQQTKNSTECTSVYKKNKKHLNLRVSESESPTSQHEDVEKYLIDTRQ